MQRLLQHLLVRAVAGEGVGRGRVEVVRGRRMSRPAQKKARGGDSHRWGLKVSRMGGILGMVKVRRTGVEMGRLGGKMGTSGGRNVWVGGGGDRVSGGGVGDLERPPGFELAKRFVGKMLVRRTADEGGELCLSKRGGKCLCEGMVANVRYLCAHNNYITVNNCTYYS